jgi:hypothetical protein
MQAGDPERAADIGVDRYRRVIASRIKRESM